MTEKEVQNGCPQGSCDPGFGMLCTYRSVPMLSISFSEAHCHMLSLNLQAISVVVD